MTKVNAIHCTLTPEEERAYVDWATERYGVEPVSMDIEFDGEFANVRTTLGRRPYERIRRITGYLVGTPASSTGSARFRAKAPAAGELR